MSVEILNRDITKKEKMIEGKTVTESYDISKLEKASKVVECSMREIEGGVIGEFRSHNTAVIYHVAKETLYITCITSEKHNIKSEVEYRYKPVGKVDDCVYGFKESGIVEVLAKMTEVERWNSIVVEVSEKYETNEKFAKVIPGAIASGTKLSEMKRS